MKRISIIAIIVIVIAVSGLLFYRSIAANKPDTTNATNPTARVQESDFVMTSYGMGFLEGSTSVTLSFPISGVVADIPVKLGDTVQINDIVASLVDDEKQILLNKAIINLEKLIAPSVASNTEINIYKAQDLLNEAEMNLETVIAGPAIEYYLDQLDSATKNYYSTLERINNLKNPPTRLFQALENAKIAMDQAQLDLDYALTYVVPEEDIQRAQAEVNLASANLDVETSLLSYISGNSEHDIESLSISDELIDIKQAEWQVMEAQQALSNTKLTTPIAGFVSNINIVTGESINSNTAVMTINNPEEIALRFYLDESEYSGLSVGDPVQVSFNAYPDTIFSAKVTKIDFSIVTVDGENKIQAWAVFDEPLATLPIGAEADVEVLTVEEKNVLTIPYQALIKDASGQYQVIVLSDGQFEYRTITIGMSDFANVIVKSGLKAGEIVSTNPDSFGEEE